MKDLYIFDVSSVIYHGVSCGYRFNIEYGEMPLSGVAEIMKYTALALGERADVIYAFDSRESFRKELYSDYKKGRTPNRLVYAQIDLLEELLSKIGLPCYRVDKYEADDLISWAVKEFSDKYHGTTIYSSDKDITHNVKKNVQFKPLRQDEIIIGNHNFTRAVVKNEVIPFNTISAYKVFNGCSSDSIPAFKSENGEAPGVMFEAFKQFLSDNGFFNRYEYTTDYRVLWKFIYESELFTDKDRKQLQIRIRLVYPALKPEEIVLEVSGINMVNKDILYQVLSMCKDKYALRCCKGNFVEISKDINDVVRSYARAYRTGAYSVDRNLEVDPSYEETSELMMLKEF